MLKRWWLLTCLLLSSLSLAAEKNTEHTLRLGSDDKPPAATIEDAAWLAGTWEGKAFGGSVEEVWNPPSAETMVGMFKVFDEQGVKFYELMLVQEEQGSLVMKVKHFSADFSAWEEKSEYVAFPLVKIAPGELHFAGLSFLRNGSDNVTVYLAMDTKQGTREERLDYQRVE